MIAPVSSATAAPLRVFFSSAAPIAPVAPVSRQATSEHDSKSTAPVSEAAVSGLDLTPPARPGVSVAAQEGGSETENTDSGSEGSGGSAGGEELSQEEQAQVAKLKARDREVRAHEQAHAAAGGAQAGAPSYSYQQGPDGRQYAVGGEVPIKASASSSDPQAAIRQLEQVVRAALAPAQPSGQDRAVAAGAQAQIAQLRAQAAQENRAKAEEAINPEGSQGGSATGEATGPAEGQPLLPALPKFDGTGASGGESGDGPSTGATLGKPVSAYQQAGGSNSNRSGALLSVFA
ncbi:MAG: hypothetical protein FJX55_02555 [Alphaproteobacteria bacterium]|nr:hypothetical protein [Alphaproteobacteria bacterium]